MRSARTEDKPSAPKALGYLGEPWREPGALAGFEAAIDQGPGLFLGAVAAFSAVGAATFVFLWYLAAPRLAEFSAILPEIILVAGGIFFVYFIVEYLGLLATTYTRKNFLLPLARSKRFVVKLAVPARRLARLFGSTPDRMTHSAVRVSNALTRALKKRAKSEGPVLVLLPRCLQRPECEQPLAEDIDNCRRCGQCPVAGILDVRDDYDDVVMAVLTGGSVVPAVVSRLAPRAVIGVACERELITGIYVVGDRPVLGVANQRPEGPCRATSLEMGELRAALEPFATLR